jgi:hypothetical protein
LPYDIKWSALFDWMEDEELSMEQLVHNRKSRNFSRAEINTSIQQSWICKFCHKNSKWMSPEENARLISRCLKESAGYGQLTSDEHARNDLSREEYNEYKHFMRDLRLIQPENLICSTCLRIQNVITPLEESRSNISFFLFTIMVYIPLLAITIVPSIVILIFKLLTGTLKKTTKAIDDSLDLKLFSDDEEKDYDKCDPFRVINEGDFETLNKGWGESLVRHTAATILTRKDTEALPPEFDYNKFEDDEKRVIEFREINHNANKKTEKVDKKAKKKKDNKKKKVVLQNNKTNTIRVK